MPWTFKHKLQDEEGAGGAAGGAAGEDTGAGTSGTPDWREALPETVRTWDEAQNAESADAFYEQMGNMRARMGRSISLPPSEAGEEEWAAFNERLKEKVPGLMNAPDFTDESATREFLARMGLPEEPAGYEFPEIEGINLPEERQEVLRAAAHKVGIPAKMMKEFMAEVLADDAAHAADVAAFNQAEQAKLHEAWGNAFDSKMGLAQKVSETFLGGTDISNWPADLVQGLAKIGTQMGGEGSQLLQQGEGGQGAPAMTPQEAAENADRVRDQLRQLTGADPRRQGLLDKLVKYEKMANPMASTETNLRNSFTSGA